MSAFWFVAAIIGCFFVVGMLVGFLIVAAIPGVAYLLAARSYRAQQPPLDPAGQLGTGPPAGGPGRPEPDDRDFPPSPPDSPWWRGGA